MNCQKLSVIIPPSLTLALQQLARRRGTTLTEVIKSAITTEKFFSDLVAQGKTILIEDTDKTIRQLVFLK